MACYISLRMGLLFFFFHWWSLLLQGIAIVHFIRRRPDTYWIFIILFLGWIGAAVYIVAEVIPDASLLRGSFQVFPRRRRIRELENAILDNPSAGNYEELGLLYLDDEDFAKARGCYDRSIAQRTDSVDPFYRRGVAEVELGDFAAAVPDLERAVQADPTYDFHRAIGLLAHAYAQTGQAEKAAKLFEQAIKISTSSETYYNYALFLQSQRRTDEARQWLQKIIEKRATMPGYQRRRERGWFRKAYGMMARLRL
ncbi:MAG: tetratricopeptide repeat protein [Candidatus Sulfotelmatobacter sp.]